MPLYEYRCKQCERVFELIQKFSDAPLTVHEACGGEVERIVSAPALQFKGSGWYITDYARSTEKKKDGADSKGESKPAETKTESAPAKPESTTTPGSKS
ncbi:MAG: zinc ribbon domain-containing protein [Acidobacteria bacterium]|nr:zinc ribbon domain-containing protein [Acidobacteriota bacterium]